MAGAIKELESLSDDLGQYEAKKEALRNMVEKYQKRAGEAASKIARSEEMIKRIESNLPQCYNWAERVPTERSEDEIKADQARIEKKIKAAEVCSYLVPASLASMCMACAPYPKPCVLEGSEALNC